jgi:hypothetical protein
VPIVRDGALDEVEAIWAAVREAPSTETTIDSNRVQASA